MRLLNVSVVLAAALLFSDQAFSCSVAQRADFAKAGYSKSEIESMCKGGSSGSPAGSVKQGGANNSGLSTKFDYRGTWNPIECHAFSKTEKKIVKVSDGVCREIIKHDPQPFTLGEILYNKRFRFSAVQEGNTVVLEPDEPRLNWPLVFEIISNDRIRVKIPDITADLFGRDPAFRLYARAGSTPQSTPTSTSGTLGATTPPGKRLFGTWRIVSCDYWRDYSERLANVPCRTQRNDHRVEYKPGSMTFNDKERPVEYVDSQNVVDMREQDGEITRHVFDTEKNEVSMFNNDKANNRLLRFVIVRVDGTPPSSGAPQVPATPATNDSSGFVPVGMQAASGKDLSFLKKALKITDNVKMVVGRADFNGDQQDDYLVVLQSSLYCGSGGCSTFLVLGGKQPTAYETNGTYIENQFAVSTNMHKGIKNVVYMMDGKPVLGEKRGTPLYGKVLEYEFERAMK